MKKTDAREAGQILARTMEALLGTVPASQGRAGSDVRRAVGDLLAHAPTLLHNDEAGEPTALCFENARLANVTMVKFAGVIRVTAAETPVTLGGILTKNSLIQFALATVSHVIADMTFESRQDADKVRAQFKEIFTLAAEQAADDMDTTTYLALVTLHAALVNHLLETARPLPRIMRYRFARPLPTLVAAYRLYDDASRCDDLRAENKVVHPAFMRREGLALSA